MLGPTVFAMALADFTLVLIYSVPCSVECATPLCFAMAFAGFTKVLKHLDDHEVVLSATGVTRPGDYHYIKGEGMPHFNDELRKGDLWVQYSVAFPASLTDSQRQAIKELLGDIPTAPPNQ